MFRRIALTGALAAACSIAGVAESSPSSTAIVYHSRRSAGGMAGV